MEGADWGRAQGPRSTRNILAGDEDDIMYSFAKTHATCL